MSERVAWRRLEVGPPQLEPRRLRVPYTIEDAEGRHTQLLTFRWAEDVFDPSAAADQNLAALVGAQVALNYGLFCEELVLRGPLDPVDQAFLVEMARNTAAEIYVNKLRKPNTFLAPGFNPPPVADPAALCAPLRFPDAVEATPAAPWGEGVAVLASGGKDSLLTQGVCEELGVEPHALFANESGRHWYTALNAWRHLQATRPARTARVWTDCDRMYLFALRRMPFIRADFARLRADDYPIRLWTVAVFLMGVLPMMRARGLGTVLIGDEWDSTQLGRHEGVAHYCGYFDQSRFFDEALTAFFRAKGWGLEQRSLLRPLSELLIEDVLSARYPELFQQQVSCHAASVAGERVLPCGRCEKCRRIVGMLTALGRDPAWIGYTPESQARCLAALAERGAKQDEDGEHLAALLVASGHVPAESPFGRHARRHPETTCLRFDPLRNPLEAAPSALVEGACRIFLEHAEGAVQQQGAGWAPLELVAAEEAR